MLWEWGPYICIVLFWRIWCLGQIFLYHASFVPKTINLLKKYDGVLISKFWENLWWSSNFGLIKKCLKWKIMHLIPTIFLDHIQALLTKIFFWPKLGSNQWPLDNFLPSTSHVVNTHGNGSFCTKYTQNRTVFSRLLWSRITSHNEIRAWQPHQLCPTFLFWSYLGDSGGFYVIWILRFIFAKMATIYMYKYLILQQKRCILYISI